jgi:hypothetical protein
MHFNHRIRELCAMSLYIVFISGIRFWMYTTAEGKRVVSRDEAAAIFHRMQAARVEV